MDRTSTRTKSTDHEAPTPSKSGARQHTLPRLPYDYSALEPFIDATTMRLHHDEHHGAYVEKLNEALEPYAQLRERSATWLLLNSESRSGIRPHGRPRQRRWPRQSQPVLAFDVAGGRQRPSALVSWRD